MFIYSQQEKCIQFRILVHGNRIYESDSIQLASPYFFSHFTLSNPDLFI